MHLIQIKSLLCEKSIEKAKTSCRNLYQAMYNIILLILMSLLMNCLFCKIARGEIATAVVFEDSELMVFRDIKPQAPHHLLIIPKSHIATINETTDNDEQLLGRMLLRAKKTAQNEGISEDGYRLVFNINSGGGQEVYHIHLHLLGGRQMTWPPG
jgi:histidine triad (HIT) family protein